MDVVQSNIEPEFKLNVTAINIDLSQSPTVCVACLGTSPLVIASVSRAFRALVIYLLKIYHPIVNTDRLDITVILKMDAKLSEKSNFETPEGVLTKARVPSEIQCM